MYVCIYAFLMGGFFIPHSKVARVGDGHPAECSPHTTKRNSIWGHCASFQLLGRLLRVDLIKPVSNVRPPVRPQKVSSISMTFGV